VCITYVFKYDYVCITYVFKYDYVCITYVYVTLYLFYEYMKEFEGTNWEELAAKSQVQDVQLW